MQECMIITFDVYRDRNVSDELMIRTEGEDIVWDLFAYHQVHNFAAI